MDLKRLRASSSITITHKYSEKSITFTNIQRNPSQTLKEIHHNHKHSKKSITNIQRNPSQSQSHNSKKSITITNIKGNPSQSQTLKEIRFTKSENYTLNFQNNHQHKIWSQHLAKTLVHGVSTALNIPFQLPNIPH